MSKFMSLVEEFADLMRRIKALEQEAAPLKTRAEELKDEILERYPASGLGTSFKLASGGTIVVSEHATAKIVDRAAMVAWFQEHAPDLLGVHSATLLSYCREEMSKAAPLPAGVEVGTYPRLALRA